MRCSVAVVAVLLAAACSGPSGSSGAVHVSPGGSPDPLVTPSPASTEVFLERVASANTVLPAKAKYGDTASLPWTFQRLDDGGASIVISYQPSNLCLRDNEAVLTDETSATVTMTVVQRVVEVGTCPMGGRPLVRVTLRQPLGDRQLLHGSLADG